MEKCRICLKSRLKLLPLSNAEDGVTFLDKIISLTNVKINYENGMPDKICRSCRKKLRAAYDFKTTIERSEMILNETANLKRFSFNNINDIKIQIEIDTDCKPNISNINIYSEESFNNSENSIVYNDVVIKKIKEDNNDKQNTQITVKEFLNSVKMESDNDYDHDYELDVEYDPNSDNHSTYEIELTKKNYKKVKSKGKRSCKSNRSVRYPLINNPIAPVYLKDIRLMPTAYKRQRRDKARKAQSSKRTSVCPYCGKILLIASLDTHILLHSGERPFKCDMCSKAYFKESGLTNHKKMHTDPKKYKCEQCIATFCYKDSLRSHLKTVHCDQKKHVCDICKKAFKRKCHLNRHVLIHNFGNKPVQCQLCSMSFITKYNLKHHMRVHTGERPFKCEICAQPYSYKHDFNRHCLKKHGVFLKRRSVNIMNEEVLQRERALMRDLTLHAHGIIKDDEILKVFDGPQGAMAYTQALKAIEARQIPVSI